MATLIRRGLLKEGLAADIAPSGEEALVLTGAHAYDAIVLDVMLPGISGFETCRMLRARRVWSPVLMLTARDAVRDRVQGLDSGADDYLVKPFALAELHARLRSLHRRGRSERPAVLEFGDLRLDHIQPLQIQQQQLSVERLRLPIESIRQFRIRSVQPPIAQFLQPHRICSTALLNQMWPDAMA